jgi:hypothetical protein
MATHSNVFLSVHDAGRQRIADAVPARAKPCRAPAQIRGVENLWTDGAKPVDAETLNIFLSCFPA